MTKQPITYLLEFLKQEYQASGTFKEFYDGDPDLIPNSNMPCLAVTKLNDRTGNGPTGYRRVIDTLQVKVIMNRKDDWIADIDPTQLTEKRIRDHVERIDPATGGYDSTTIKYAIMNRFQVEGLALDTNMTFELGTLPRPQDTLTQEGHLTLEINYLVPNAPIV